MSILQNAVDSLLLGVEDYNSTDSRRLLSCTRNVFAGILLLFKQKLVELSPSATNEVLIKEKIISKINSSNVLEWEGIGKKTVNVQQIKERFACLGINVDWNRFDRINKHRNEIEHYYSTISHDTVRTILSDSFIIIRDFIRKQLNKDPLLLLGQEAWSFFMNISEIYEKEKLDCVQSMQAVDWKYTTLEKALTETSCENCGSGLIEVINTSTDRLASKFKCRACGKGWDFEDLAEKSMIDYFSHQNYIAEKDGGDPSTIDCPECNHATYILEDNECVICENSVERICKMCAVEIPSQELDGTGYCSWCYSKMNND